MAGPGFPRRLAVLGSTGSIGRQALDVVRAHRDAFTVVGLAAGHASRVFLSQVDEFAPAYAGISRGPGEDTSTTLGLTPGCVMLQGDDAAVRVVEESGPDLVLDAVTGFVGLRPALAALRQGCLLAMAAKEAIVTAAHLLKEAAGEGQGEIVPVDGEPRAVLECLRGPHSRDDLRRVYLTASGGPFWGRTRTDFERATPVEALRHPCWTMGPKISVDSATLFNKGLEVLEIALLLDLPVDLIEVIVQPQSVVHSLVEFRDGSMLGQLGPRDMRVAIGQALFHPWRAPSSPSRLQLKGLCLQFEEPVLDDWPCLAVAVEAGRLGGTMPAAISAADEELVALFLQDRIPLGTIGRGLQAAFAAHLSFAQEAGRFPPLERLVAADAWARGFVREWCESEGAVL